MFSRKVISVIVLSCCLFKSLSCVFFETLSKNTHDRQIDKNLGKPVFSFANTLNGLVLDQWLYTTELSRILLVGEPRVFETVRYLPVVNIISEAGPLFDNRFENFIKNVGQSSQEQLQEAIKDAILLSPYSTKAYSASVLLDYLAEALQNEIMHTRSQITHDFKWDQKSLHYMKKSVVWALGFAATKAVSSFIATKTIAKKYNALKWFDTIATFGVLPASYRILNGCYKVLATDPNACNQYLERYEELLSFVQELKAQLQADGFITFKLTNGRVATLKNNKLTFSE